MAVKALTTHAAAQLPTCSQVDPMNVESCRQGPFRFVRRMMFTFYFQCSASVRLLTGVFGDVQAGPWSVLKMVSVKGTGWYVS